MFHDPWFTLIFMIIPLSAGAINKFLLVKGKKKGRVRCFEPRFKLVHGHHDLNLYRRFFAYG